MASDDPAGTRPGPVVLRIKLRYDDVDAMVERFAPNVGRSGLFLPTRSLQPIGTEVKFELRLADGRPALVGLGRVQSVKEPDPGDPRATYGIGVELMRVTRESRELILKLLAQRRQLGLSDVAVPQAEEIDAARRAAADGAAVPQLIGASPSAAQAIVSQPIVLEASAPAAEAQDHLLTAPRPTTEPAPIRAAAAIAPLAAEPPRRKRRPVSELIEHASGSIASSLAIPGLDDDVDVGKALARARALATGDLDQELEQLRDQTAAPLAEISIEAASAELARQLGGVAVVRARSQGWAPPPVVADAEASPADARAGADAAAVEPAPAAALVASEPEPAPPPEPEPEPVVASEPAPAPAVASEPEPPPTPATLQNEGLANLRDRVRRRRFGTSNIELLHTEPAASVAPAASAAPVAPAAPAEPAAPAVDRTAPPPREPLSSRGAGARRAARALHQLEDLGDEAEHTQIGSLPMADPSAFEETAVLVGGAIPAAVHLPSAVPPADEGAPASAEEIVEFDDFEILAEADAADADLLSAHGEAELGAAELGAAELGAAELGAASELPQPAAAHLHHDDSDFAARLDLDDDDDSGFHAAAPAAAAHAPLTLDPRELSAGHALAALDDVGEPAELDARHARVARPPSYAGHGGHAGGAQRPRDPADEFSAHHAGLASSPFDDSEVLASPPVMRAPSAARAPDYDLEAALGVLDDDLDRPPRPAPVSQTAATRVVRPATAAPARRAPRATTEDGILIDFDDDE